MDCKDSTVLKVRSGDKTCHFTKPVTLRRCSFRCGESSQGQFVRSFPMCSVAIVETGWGGMADAGYQSIKEMWADAYDSMFFDLECAHERGHDLIARIETTTQEQP